MNIQYRGSRLGVTNIGEFQPGEVKLVPPDDQHQALRLIERSNGDYIETALAPGRYSLKPNERHVTVSTDETKKKSKKSKE